MSTFIRSEAVLVPPSHFQSADGARALQLHLSIDVTGPPDGQDDKAWERFKAFLGRAPDFAFQLWAVRGIAAEPVVLTRLGGALDPDVDGVFNWISERTDRWQWDPTASGGEPGLSAGQLLGASATWPPPPARNAGLAATLTVPPGIDPSGMIVLPYLAEFEPAYMAWVEELIDGKTQLFAEYEVNGAQESFRVEVFPIAEVPAVGNELVDPATGMLFTAGGGGPDEEAHLVHEMLGALALRGASQLSAAHVLLGLSWPHFEPAVPEDEGARYAGRLLFRGVSALAAMFDPVLLSLVMPGSQDEGPFIGAMFTALGEALADAEPNPRTLDETIVDITVLNLKRRLAAYLVILGTAPNDRKAFAAKLRLLLELAPAPAEGTGEAFWRELLVHFESYDPGTAPRWEEVFGKRTPDDVEQSLVADLGRLLQWLEGQHGSEAVALKLLQVCLLENGAGEITLADKELALRELDARMKRDFNGADAARAAVGTLLADALVAGARARKPFWSADELRDAIADASSNWFTGRIWKSALVGSPFEAILTVLPTLGPVYLAAEDADPAEATGRLADLLTEAWHDARRQLLGNSDQIRFADSKIPLPLPVRINADADVAHGDLFAYHYAGLGVLIRRAEEPWAHANLATYLRSLPGPGDTAPDPLNDPIWVQPLLPAAVNGRRELFKDYNGFAFFEADLGPSPTGQAAPENAPYRLIDAPSRKQLDHASLQALPGLSYGTRYEMAAFAILRGGLLPTKVAMPGEPWRPKAGGLKIEDAHLAKRTYCRTTMVGAVQLTGEGLQYPKDPGIGVQPLADDYPRKSVASNGEAAWFDLWRNSDGSGAIALPDVGDTVRMTLHDVAAWGSESNIGVHIQSHPGSLLPNHAAAKLKAHIPAAFAGKDLELLITNLGNRVAYQLRAPRGGFVIAASSFEAAADEIGGDLDIPVFARLSLVAATAPASLSFADPAQALRGDADAVPRAGAKVMLAAPSSEFITPQGKLPLSFRIDYPRVSYQDFERWLSNPDLARPLIPDEVAAGKLLNLLLKSYLAGELAEGLVKFPDPAVRHLLIELTPLDGLTDDPETLVKKHKSARQVVKLDSFTELAKATTLDGLMAAIDAQFGADWTIEEGDLAIETEGRRICVPEGMSAQLSVRPLVSRTLFTKGPILDPRLAQWAQGTILRDAIIGDLDSLIFDGPVRVIEMMMSFAKTLPDFASRAFDFVGVRAAGTARSYDLVAAPPTKADTSDWQWRRFASAEVKVQQWRFMGRPITHWFDPKALTHGSTRGVSILRLDKLDDAAALDLKRFESEAFLDRDDDDAQLYAVSLSPLDLGRDGGGGVAVTALHNVPWSDASATMIRHRLALVSRYAGALARPPLGRVDVIGASRPASERRDWLRVIFLADAARLDLTRPQLRALIPLTVASSAKTAPPVMALLDEPPLAHGGLAGRIAASIRTGLGYHVPRKEDGQPEPILKLFDARAEFGPDPQLRYRPTDPAVARALTLLPEGPIGLTFDAPTVRAPAFPNSAMILAPHILRRDVSDTEADLQEHFASVALRRYLDHRWLVEDASPASDELPADRSWWIECTRSETLHYGGEALCTIEQAKDSWTIAIANRTFVFAAGKDTASLDLAAIDRDQAEGIALLHQPLANGRASLTIFAIPSAAVVEEGIPQTPLALASVEWAKPDHALLDQALTGTAKLSAYPVVASAETPMNWVRTAHDADRVSLCTAIANAKSAAYQVRDLQIVAATAAIAPQKGAGDTLYHLRASYEDSKVVLELQRRLAFIKTRPIAGLGERIETFESAQLLMGSALPLAATDARSRVRIAELEIKAVPIAAGTAPAKYQQAVFDLKAIGREKAAGLGFWIRPVGTYRKVGAGFALELKLAGIAGSGWPERRMTLKPANGETFTCRTILLCADKDAVRGWFLNANGELVGAAVTSAVTREASDEGEKEAVRIADLNVRDASGPHGAWWADIAMLSLKKMPAAGDIPTIELDFDWLFTGTLDKPTDAVAPSGLNAMKEAEARLLSVSEPIDIL